MKLLIILSAFFLLACCKEKRSFKVSEFCLTGKGSTEKNIEKHDDVFETKAPDFCPDDDDDDDFPENDQKKVDNYNSMLHSECAKFCRKNCETLIGFCGHEDFKDDGYGDPNTCYCAFSSEHYELAENLKD